MMANSPTSDRTDALQAAHTWVDAVAEVRPDTATEAEAVSGADAVAAVMAKLAASGQCAADAGGSRDGADMLLGLSRDTCNFDN